MLAYICILAISIASIFAQNPCSPLRLQTGIPYAPDPNTCERFVQCSGGTAGSVASWTLNCGCGQYWSQSLLTCVRAGNQGVCSHNPCANVPTGSVGRAASRAYCNAYWTCLGNIITGMECCGSNERTDPGGQCIAAGNNPCATTCPCTPPPATPAWECKQSAVPGQPTKYIQHGDYGNYVMDCAGGTEFETETCGCNKHVASTSSCTAFELSLADNMVRDSMGSYIEKMNVAVSNNAANFDGTSSYLKLWRFAGQDWQRFFAAEITFTAAGNSDAYLLFASENTAPAPVDIRLQSGSVVATVRRTGSANPVSVTASYSGTQQNTVKFKFDGMKAMLSVQQGSNTPNSDEANAAGNLVHSSFATLVGRGATGNYLDGTIRTLNIYNDCVPANWMPSGK